MRDYLRLSFDLLKNTNLMISAFSSLWRNGKKIVRLSNVSRLMFNVSSEYSNVLYLILKTRYIL